MTQLRLLRWFLLALFFAQQSFSSTQYVTAEEERRDVCDNGAYLIQNDLVEEEKECTGEPLRTDGFSVPAGVGQCQDPPVTADTGNPVCMEIPISYTERIPSSGDYRPLPPVYGEYDYLPPQRWIRDLSYGAIVFLYHPCAPQAQVMELRKLARTCLRKHIITPYSKLSEHFPLALVSLGCVYEMSWVNPAEASQWIKVHALKTPLSGVVQVGGYNHGLEKDASSFTLSSINDTAVCPSYEVATIQNPDSFAENTSYEETSESTTTSESTATSESTEIVPSSEPQSLCANLTSTTTCEGEGEDQGSFIGSHPFLLLLILMLLAVVLGLTLVTAWVCCCQEGQYCRGRSSRTGGKYKSVGNFFVPLLGGGEGKNVSIAIPEMGVPNAMPSEREKLLLESDEDEV